MTKFIDFHTHKIYNTQTITITTYLIQDLNNTQLPKNHYFTIGLHPWEVNNFNLNFALETINNICKQYPNCLAIGEIGLDKLKPNFELQQQAFELQLNLAAKLNKPVILHIVKAYNELIPIIKKFTNVKIAIHGFSANSQIANSLQQKGIYLSFGKNLFKSKKNQIALQNANLSKIFLETDVFNYSIQEIYIFASKILNFTLDELKQQIANNCEQFFGRNLVCQN